MSWSDRGFTLVGVMISVSIISLLAALGIPQLLRSKMIANESAARAGLRAISTALETYAIERSGAYPIDVSVLTTSRPPYLNKDYIADSPFQGYSYTCESDISGYSCSAEPAQCGRTGSKKYTITTSSVLTEGECE
jgi:prepilin-type N-terminal cleavage/methylation domain-containing protein